MNCSVLKAVAVVVAVLAAAASYVSAAYLSGGFLSPPRFLWVAANVIVAWLWLVPSYRDHTAAAGSSSPDSHADDVYAAMHSLYPSSEHGVFADAVAAAVAPVSKRQPREARTGGKRTDRPRVRRKLGGEVEARAVAAEAMPDGKKKLGEVEEVPMAVAAEAARPDCSDDVSMDSAWQAILQRGTARPVRNSETWGSDERPRLDRAADKAVARREMRKSATTTAKTAVSPSQARAPAPAPAAKQGWRTRDVLVIAHDELLRRAESLIRRHHEHLRLQRQESEQRQAMEHQRRLPALIRV